ncbi:MAG: hypothetical protein WC099_01225 [Candidatus Paceibacterota bacterium]
MKKALCSLALPVLLVVCLALTPPVVQASQQKVAVTVNIVITPTLDPANIDVGLKQSSLNLTAAVGEMTSLITQKTSSTQVEKVEAIAEEIINQENLAGMITQGTLVTQVTTIEKVEGNTIVQKNNGAINADVGSVNLLTSTSKNIVGTEAATDEFIITKMAKVKGNQSRVISCFSFS